MINRYLIVSLGSIGRRHLQNLRVLEPHSQIGVLRLSGDADNSLPEGADILLFSIEEAVAFAPAAAIICSPSTFHLQPALSLVKAGVSLLVEKPIANESKGIEVLFALAKDIGVTLMTGYNLRFMPSLIEARRLVLSGEIGNLMGVRSEVGQFLPDWRPNLTYQNTVSARNSLGGGAMLELSHEIDYIYWILGSPSRIFAMGGKYSSLEIDVEDMASLSLEYDDPRVLVNIHLDFLQRSVSRSCKFIGSEGTLIWDGVSESISLFSSDTMTWTSNRIPCVPNKNAMYIDELSHFLNAVHQRNEFDLDEMNGLQVLRIVEAAKQSIANGKVIHF